MTAEPSVFLVDDDDAVRRALHRVLKKAGFAVQVFGSAEQFLAAVPADADGCLVLDIRMSGRSGLEVQDELAGRARQLPIVFITGHGDVRSSVRAMKAGAVDFLEKPVEASHLVAAVQRGLARAGDARRQAEAISQIERRWATLTPREREIMAAVVAGLTNRRIAERFGITEQTVKVHRGRVMEKMGADSLADLVRMAGRLGAGSGGA